MIWDDPYFKNLGSPRVSRIPEPYPPSRDPTLFTNNPGSKTGFFQNQFVQPVEHKVSSEFICTVVCDYIITMK